MLPIFEGAFCVSSREADMGTRLAGGGLHVVRRYLALRDEPVGVLERLVPAAVAHQVEEQVCVGEADVLAVAELLREVERCPDELLGANQLPSVSRQDAEIVEDDRREGRVDRLGQLVCAFELLLARVLEQGLGAADRRQRVDPELVEIEHVRQRQRLHTERIASSPSLESMRSRARRQSTRAFATVVPASATSSCARSMWRCASSPCPRTTPLEKKRLRLAGGLSVADLEQSVAGLLER